MALTYDLGLGPTIHRERLCEAPLYAAVGPDHRLAGRSHGSLPSSSPASPWSSLDLPHSRDYFTEVFARLGFAPAVRHRFTSFEAVRAMVARGQGFTLLNQRPVHDLTYDGGRLVAIDLDDEVGGLDMVLASIVPVSALSRRAQGLRRAVPSGGHRSRRPTGPMKAVSIQ